MNTDELIPLVITAAVASAGPMKDTREWSDNVMLNITRVGTLLNEGSREWKLAHQMLEAPVFVAKFVSFEVEQTSTRCLVQLDSGRPGRNYPDGIEPIRSERTDNALGAAMKARLERLKPGDEIAVWKGMDELPSGDKARVLLNFKFLRRADSAEPKHTEEQFVPASEEVVVERAPESRASEEISPDASEARQGGPTGDVAFALEQFNDLSARDKAAVARAVRDAGISFPTPTPDEVDRFLAIIGEVTNT